LNPNLTGAQFPQSAIKENFSRSELIQSFLFSYSLSLLLLHLLLRRLALLVAVPQKTMNGTEDMRYDGMWSYLGLFGMMLHFHDDGEERPEIDSDAMEFVDLSPLQDVVTEEDREQFLVRLQEDLMGRNLHLADGVLRRLVEEGGTSQLPSKVRVRRMTIGQLNHLLSLKRKGNEAFGNRDYDGAVGYYDEALASSKGAIQKFYVAPVDQVEEVVNVLSNRAECELRQRRFRDAAETATDALFLMNNHEKSRIRRVRAELAVGKEAASHGGGYQPSSPASAAAAAYFIQAKCDLQEVMDNPERTEEGTNSVQKQLPDVQRCLDGAKVSMLRTNPNANWELYEQRIQATCW
jgi:hypothetical protein